MYDFCFYVWSWARNWGIKILVCDILKVKNHRMPFSFFISTLLRNVRGVLECFS